MNNLTVEALGDPKQVAALSVEERRLVMAKLLVANNAVMEMWVKDLEEEQLAKQRARGDRLLGMEEMAERLHCSLASLRRGWKAGRYPFILKDGGRLVGSEDGLERWIAARVKRQSRS